MSENESEIVDVEIVEPPNLPALANEGEGAMKATEPERDWPQGPTAENRCVAHKKNGEQCRRHAIKGATVCRVHGGAAGHVRRAAKARLDNAADLMAQKLLGIAIDDSLPAETRLKAIKDALDRSMGRPTSTVEVGPIEPKPWEEIFDQIGGSPSRDYAMDGYEVDQDRSAAKGYGFDGKTFDPPPAMAVPGHESSRERPSAEELERIRQAASREFASDTNAQAGERPTSEPPKPATPAQHHITGEDALAINARLIREQRAIESPHKRYTRP